MRVVTSGPLPHHRLAPLRCNRCRCANPIGATTMIMERGARPDALPGEARRRRRDAILVVAVIIVFIVILAWAYWH